MCFDALAASKPGSDEQLALARTLLSLVLRSAKVSVASPPVRAGRELAQAMVASLGGGLMGVDVLVAQDGRLLALEANAPFGFDITDPAQGRWVARAALAAAGLPV